MRGAVAAAVRAVLEAGRDEGVFPSAVARVSRDGRVLAHEAVGDATADTRFDVASLTKLFTATAAGLLWHRGALSLEQEVAGAATVEDLLRHRGGLAAWRPFYEEARAARDGGGPSPGCSEAARRGMVERVEREPRVAEPGAVQVYSDLGFIQLGEVVARAAGEGLDVFVHREVCGAMGLPSTRYQPWRQGAGDPTCAPTERCPWRLTVLRGEVHDDNAWAMGGVAGHAGLFSDARDLWRFAEAWRRADLGEEGPLPVAVARRFWVPPIAGGTYALGWDTPSPGASSTGTGFSARSFGHLGFTGTSLWVDAPRRLTVVLLTNRVHPSRANEAIRAFRPRFHDAVSAALARR